MTTKKLWIGFIAVMAISFSVLLYFGREIYKSAPPIPVKVITLTEKAYSQGRTLKMARMSGNL